MKILMGFGLCLYLVLFLAACGGSDVCSEEEGSTDTSTCSASRESVAEAMQIGDFCDDEGIWMESLDGKDKVALRCNNSVLGDRTVDRLKCSRKGYGIKLSSDTKFAYCQSETSEYSFLYDTDFGSYKPWLCAESSSPSSVKAVDSEGTRFTLYCINRIYRPQSSDLPKDDGSSVGGTCKVDSGADDDVFAVMTFDDFEPADDQVESFDPSSFCDAPTDTSSTPADNVSGSFLMESR